MIMKKKGEEVYNVFLFSLKRRFFKNCHILSGTCIERKGVGSGQAVVLP